MPRVLVVDDSAVARRAIVQRLSARGCEVVEAASSAEGVAADLSGIGAAVLDLELGDGTGVDVASAIRARAPELPILFFTSAPRSELARAARAIARVLAKPDDLEEAVEWAVAEATRPSS